MVINGRKYVLVNKGRFFTFVFVMIGLIFFIFFSSNVSGSGHQTEETIIQYTVSPGDTLCNIASSYRNSTEIRKYISRVMELNRMTSADIYVGDTLLIPVND